MQRTESESGRSPYEACTRDLLTRLHWKDVNGARVVTCPRGRVLAGEADKMVTAGGARSRPPGSFCADSSWGLLMGHLEATGEVGGLRGPKSASADPGEV